MIGASLSWLIATITREVRMPAKDSGKPDNVIDKMVDGRMRKYFEDVVLLKQPFVLDPEKTVADCFKFRHKIGIDVALEALKLCRARKGFRLRKLIHYARLCRVEQIMRPYLEALS